MASGVIYLDIDDEITSAASRIRGSEGRRVAVVLPYGSRVSTSRINFRLLARDAMAHEKRLSIVAGDAAARALAASAGLPVFASVVEYESSLATEGAIADHPVERSQTIVTAPDRGAADPVDPEREPLSDDGDTAAVTVERTVRDAVTGPVPPEPAVIDDGRRAHPGARAGPSVERGKGRGRPRIGRWQILVGLAVLALASVVGGVGAYLYLPSATIAVSPRLETVGPVSLRISASTAIDAPDVEAGLVPAQIVEVDVRVDDTFAATGKRIEETKAKGSVRFVNLDPTSSNSIAMNAVVRSSSGVQFRTDAKVTVPAAELVFDPVAGKFTVEPATASVAVTAVDAGPDGNLAANTIATIPRGEEPLFLKVNNPEPTAGGARTEFPRVTQEDVDAAIATLAADLDAVFADRLDDPDLTSGDVTVFPETATLGPATPTVDPDALVGEEAADFALGLSATGTVTTVDAAPVRVIAAARLEALVDSGHTLVDGSSEITESPAVLDGGTITYPVVATARQVATLDPAKLEAEVLGKPLGEARDILAAYGDVELVVWPDWVSAIPTLDSRVDVTVNSPGSSP